MLFIEVTHTLYIYDLVAAAAAVYIIATDRSLRARRALAFMRG